MPSTESAASQAAYHERIDEVLSRLETDAEMGLAQREAAARLERYGPNELATEPPVPAWRRFLAEFKDVLVILLLGATVVSTGVWWYEGASALPYEAIAIFVIGTFPRTRSGRSRLSPSTSRRNLSKDLPGTLPGDTRNWTRSSLGSGSTVLDRDCHSTGCSCPWVRSNSTASPGLTPSQFRSRP